LGSFSLLEWGKRLVKMDRLLPGDGNSRSRSLQLSKLKLPGWSRSNVSSSCAPGTRAWLALTVKWLLLDTASHSWNNRSQVEAWRLKTALPRSNVGFQPHLVERAWPAAVLLKLSVWLGCCHSGRAWVHTVEAGESWAWIT